MTMMEKLLLTLLVASWLYWLAALIMVHIFFNERHESDLNFTPPVSILKPVKGVDAQAYENFVSFCRQDYPEYEVIFGVMDPDDPVIPVIKHLQHDYSSISIRLVICPALGSNRKASLLHQLSMEARFEVLVASDSDMRVTPDYLRRVVAPLADSRIGLVTCPYRGDKPLTLTARLEALYMTGTFLPSVVVARQFLDMRFAMGATNVMRRSDLARLGGFAAVADYLADDYQLGARMAALGLRVHLSDYVVDSVLGATTFFEQWYREVRWARCNRVSRPREYPGLLLSFSTPLAMILLIESGYSSSAWLAVAVSLLIRWWVAWSTMGYAGNINIRYYLIWLPVRDILSVIIWCAGGIGRRVTWRGEVYILLDDGRMQPAVVSLEYQHTSP